VTFQVVRSLAEEPWRRFVDEHPQGNIFHTPEMFQVFARAAGHHAELWAATDAAGQPWALLLPVQITLVEGWFQWLRRLTCRAVVWGSVLCGPGRQGREALTSLLQAYSDGVKGRCLFTELRNLADLSRLQPLLQSQSFTYEDHLNYLIDLDRPSEAVLQDIGRRAQKQIRRALRKGQVTIAEVDRLEQVAPCYELLAGTYARARVPLADRSLFEVLFDVLQPRGMVKFLTARVGEAYAATSVELIYKGTIYGWYGGLDRNYGRYNPTELLTWHILKWGAENGYCTYDFGGAGKPGEDYGVRDFKAKFGGQLVCYGRNTQVHAPAKLAISKAGYRVYRVWASSRRRPSAGIRSER